MVLSGWITEKDIEPTAFDEMNDCPTDEQRTLMLKPSNGSFAGLSRH